MRLRRVFFAALLTAVLLFTTLVDARFKAFIAASSAAANGQFIIVTLAVDSSVIEKICGLYAEATPAVIESYGEQENFTKLANTVNDKVFLGGLYDNNQWVWMGPGWKSEGSIPFSLEDGSRIDGAYVNWDDGYPQTVNNVNRFMYSDMTTKRWRNEAGLARNFYVGCQIWMSDDGSFTTTSTTQTPSYGDETFAPFPGFPKWAIAPIVLISLIVVGLIIVGGYFTLRLPKSADDGGQAQREREDRDADRSFHSEE